MKKIVCFAISFLLLVIVTLILYMHMNNCVHKDDVYYTSDGKQIFFYEEDLLYAPFDENASSSGRLISLQTEDCSVIPDRYNSGCNSDLEMFELGQTYGGVKFSRGSNGHTIINCYQNAGMSMVRIENIDFSSEPFSVYNEEIIDKSVEIVFKNCKFGHFSNSRNTQNISYTFMNCSFQYFSGSNATFKNCTFSGGANDGMNAYCNVLVENCYFFDKSNPTSSKLHTDGVQIFGSKDNEIGNIVFKNCRFEMPELMYNDTNAYVNACIMLQLEYGDGSGFRFDDCIINGGGYSIYAWRKNEGLTMSDVTVSNIRSGCLRKYGTLYHKNDLDVSVINIKDTDSLYVSSIFKEADGTHIITSNDTNEERTLLICTDKGEFLKNIPACPLHADIDETWKWSDFPFDIDVFIDVVPEWIVCYDVTYLPYVQIRYVNYGVKQLFLQEDGSIMPVPSTSD